MKKELFAAALLCALTALSALNTRRIGDLSDSIGAELQTCAGYALSGDLEAAEKSASRAKEIWDSHAVYYESVLRHTEFDTVCEDFYNISEKLLDGDGEKVSLYVSHAIEHLATVAEMERVRFGTIF